MKFSRIEIYLLILFIGVYSYFYHGAHWNQNARLDSIYAFVEDGTLKIDRFLPNPGQNLNTGDWSLYNSHYYSNKAPGVFFLGSIVYFVIYQVEALLAIDPNNFMLVSWNAFLINFFISVLPLAFSLVFFNRIVLTIEKNLKHSLLLTLLLGLGTAFLPYATQLWGHTTAAAFIIIGLYYLLNQKDYLAGIFFSVAVLCDYVAFLPIFILLLGLVFFSKRLLKIGIAAIPGILLLSAYNYFAFGAFWNLGVVHSNPVFLNNDHFLGLFSEFKLENFKLLTISFHRGIFIYMPFLIFIFIGLFIKNTKIKKFKIILAVAIVANLILNSSFNGWHGGATALARYQIIILPLMVLLLFDLRAKLFINCLIVLGMISFFNMLVIASVGPIVPDLYPSPVFDLLYPEFFKGNIAFREFPHRFQIIDHLSNQHLTAWSLGHKMGLSGLMTLMPLVFFMMLMLVLIWKESYGAQKIERHNIN